MCRHALKPHLSFNVARCACRHIGAQRCTTRSSPRCALAPGTASPGLSNARLTQSRPGAPPSPGPRVCAPGRASRPCSAPALPVLRRLSHRPGQARRIAACGPRAALEGPPAALTPTALGRYRLPLLAPLHGTRARASHARECVGQGRAARHCAAALRKLRATPQSRYLVNHRPQTARPALAPGTASPGLSNARLTQTPRWCAVTEGHASLRLVLTGGSGPLTVSHTLRFYITPHLHKCPAIRSQARSVAGHRFAPFGFCKQALCKVSDLGGTAWPQKPWGPDPTPFFVVKPSRVVCVRRSLVRRFAHCFVQRASPESWLLAPARPVTRSLRSHRPRPARPPPEGAPSGRGCWWS